MSAEQERIERELLNRGNLLINPHPPFDALVFAALARLPYVKAHVLWGAINVLFWLCFQQLLRRYTPIPRNPLRYFFLCLMFLPLWATLVQGQTTVLLLLLFSITFICLRRGQDFSAGVFLGLGLFRFHTVLPFALILLSKEQVESDGWFCGRSQPFGGAVGNDGGAGRRAVLRKPAHRHHETPG